MSHHTHTMQSWLTIEKDIVSILQVSFNYCAVAQIFLDLLCRVCQFSNV